MPFVPVRITQNMKYALETLAKEKSVSLSKVVVQSLRYWYALPEHKKYFEILSIDDPEIIQVSYPKEDSGLMTKRGPIPFAVLVRNACHLFLKKNKIKILSDDEMKALGVWKDPKDKKKP